jgi:hypothetical protein
MKQLIRFVVAGAIAVSLAVSVAAQQTPVDKWGTVGQDVMLTSCVEKGMKDNTFILTNVADVPVHPATLGRVVYWLDKKDDLKKHIGHQIRVVAKVADVKQSEMEIKAGDSEDGGWYVEIEGPGKDVRAPAGKVAEPTAGRKDEARDVKTTLVRLKVNEVLMVASGCPTH